MESGELRKLIGRTISFRGVPYLVIEALDVDGDHPQLVLRRQTQHAPKVIQGDQWGEAHRRVPETATVMVFSEPGKLNPDLADLSSQLSANT